LHKVISRRERIDSAQQLAKLEILTSNIGGV